MNKMYPKTSPARLVFSAAGFVLVCCFLPYLAIAQNRPTTLDTLHVQAVSRIDPKLPASTRSIVVLSADEVLSLPVQNISELLDWATGVDVISRSPAQSDLSIRGASFEQIVVLVNGVRMSDPQTGHFDLDLVVPLELVERVEVIRGAASALYGADAMGGVVNVVTRTDGTPIAGSVQGGSWNTMRVAVRGGAGGAGEARALSINVGGEVARSDGHREGTDYETLLFHGSVSRDFALGNARVEIGASRRDFGAQDFYAPFPSFEKTRHYTASAAWHSGEYGPLELEMRLSARRHDDDFVLIRDDPSFYRNRHTSSQGGGTILGRFVANHGLDIAAGAELFWDDLNSSNLGDHTERRGALFAEALLRRARTAVLSIGVRTDWHQGFGAFLSPSISGSVSPSQYFRVRTSVGRSFRAPTWTERYYRDPVNIGRLDLEPERAWSGETGIDLFPVPWLSVSTTLFARRSTSMIDWARPEAAPDTVPWETRNVEDATFRGVEADIELKGPFATKFTVGGNALIVESEEHLGYRSKYALRPLTEQISLGVERAFGSSATVRFRVRHGRREGDGSHQHVDLRLNVWLGVGWLRLDVQNATNFEYPDVTGARAPGRGVFLGFSNTR